MNTIIDEEIVQRSDEWYKIRLGKVTASRIADVMAKTKSGYSASRKNYMSQLVCEILTGTKEEGFTSAAMQHGIDTEGLARQAYEIETFQAVVECGFYIAPDIEQSGASPDGLVGDDGLIEIKCPNTATHIDTLLTGSIDSKYIYQMQWQMYCTGRKWCDFVSYDSRMPEHLKLFIKRVERDEKQLSEIKAEVEKFLSELNETVQKLEAINAA
jgi:putative phage-type endonuclease